MEGPSDRIYINKWIELYSNGQLREGAHYQIVFYGGRLLSHLTADSTKTSDLINILNVNTNFILVMDSDKKSRNSRMNETKKRIIDELKSVNGYVWVTKCKEIENYLSEEIIATYLGQNNLKEFEQYSALEDFLNKCKKREGSKYLSNKVLFAEKIRDVMNETNYYKKYDLKDRLKDVVGLIKKWNGIN